MESEIIRENCHWYNKEGKRSIDKCKLLTVLQCAKKKCSFCETDEEYRKRQNEFWKKQV